MTEKHKAIAAGTIIIAAIIGLALMFIARITVGLWLPVLAVVLAIAYFAHRKTKNAKKLSGDDMEKMDEIVEKTSDNKESVIDVSDIWRTYAKRRGLPPEIKKPGKKGSKK